MAYSVELATQRMQLISSFCPPVVEETSFHPMACQEFPSQRLSHFVPLQQGHDGTVQQTATRLNHSSPSLVAGEIVEGSTYCCINPQRDQFCRGSKIQLESQDSVPGSIPRYGGTPVWQCYELTEHAQYAAPWELAPQLEQPDPNSIHIHFHSYTQESFIIGNGEPNSVAYFFPSAAESNGPGQQVGKKKIGGGVGNRKSFFLSGKKGGGED